MGETAVQVSSNIPGPLLASLRRKYRFDVFVETGTAAGHTTELAAVMFDRVYTVELSKQQRAVAMGRLRDYSNIDFKLGESPKFIRDIRDDLDNRSVLFWLDAHWCGGERLGPECPLLEELAAIGEQFPSRWVVLIDDARLFFNPPPPPHRPEDWPTFSQITDAVHRWRLWSTCRFEGDVIVIEANEQA